MTCPPRNARSAPGGSLDDEKNVSESASSYTQTPVNLCIAKESSAADPRAGSVFMDIVAYSRLPMEERDRKLKTRKALSRLHTPYFVKPSSVLSFS
jgi:hypothetical protein